MGQSPSSEADNHSASQEIPLSFMEPESSLPCSQETASGTYPETDYFPEIHSNILPFMPRSSKWSLPFNSFITGAEKCHPMKYALSRSINPDFE
jgi:hypothetical protein